MTQSKSIFTAHKPPSPQIEQMAVPSGAAPLDNLGGIALFGGMFDTGAQRTDVYRTAAKHANLQETDLIPDYRRLWTESELTQALVEYLVDEILAPFHFEGETGDVEKVEEFWDLANMDQQLQIVVREGILEGLGCGDKLRAGKELAGFRWLDASAITVTVDEDGNEEWVGPQGDLKRENLFVYRPLMFPGQYRGISMVRAALLTLQGLDDLKRDIPAAVKNLAYVTRVLKLDLDRISDPQKKKDALINARNIFAKFDSATTTIIAHDKSAMEIGFLGTAGGQSAGQSRIVPVNPIIAPLIAFLTLRFALAQSQINQDGANLAIIEAQERRAKRSLDRLRRDFARTLELEVIRDILGQETELDAKKSLENEPTKVRVVYDKDPTEARKDRLTLLREWELGLITLGTYWEQAGLPREELPTDKAEKFIWELPIGAAQGTLRGAKPTEGADITAVERNQKNGDQVDSE